MGWYDRWRGGLLAIGLALAMAGAACSSTADGAKAYPHLVITGSSTVAPLAAEIGKRFEQAHPGVQVDVQTGGSSRGIADVRKGNSDIGMASRALKTTEQTLLPFTIARDGIGLILHQSNPVNELSRQQVVAIYTGQITRWSEVGGLDRPITVVHKAEGRSTQELFLHHFELDNRQVKPHVVVGDNEQGIKTVAGNPDAIGYVSIGTASYDASHGVPIRLLSVDGVAATLENVRNGQFPLSRPLNLVTREVPTGVAKEFIDFARSTQVIDLVEGQYFVPTAGG